MLLAYLICCSVNLLKIVVDSVYDSASLEGRPAPFAEAAVKEAYDRLAAGLRPPSRDADTLFASKAAARRMNIDKLWRDIHHYALDRWLEAVGGPRQPGAPKLSLEYLANITTQAEREGRTALAKRLGVSLDTLKKQLRTGKRRLKR